MRGISAETSFAKQNRVDRSQIATSLLLSISAQLHIAHIISFILLTTWLKCKFLPSFYPFYMFLAAKTFSVHRRVHNHYTKRILNLILNRKKFFGRENDALDKQKPRQNCREPSPPRKRRFITLSRSPACSFTLQSGRSASG